MDQSSTLMTAHIQFIDDRVSLIHIPLKQYATYLQPLLQLLFPVKRTELDEAQEEPAAPWANQHPFLNVSITPIECSVICSKSLAHEYFAPVIAEANESLRPDQDRASISAEDFIVISVEGEGLVAGQRVLELTSPLAMAGISIFFITTYYSDYILVPAKSRGQVIRALEERGFAFEKGTEAYVNPMAHHRNTSSTSSFDVMSPPTPPPSTVSELQARTISLLKRRNIVPQVHRDIRLIQCAGRPDSPSDRSNSNLELQLGLTKSLVHPPRLLSLTLVETESAAILLERSVLSNFNEQVLQGNMEDYLIPITLNLESLPFEATGIVCGVAGKLVGGRSGPMLDSVEMSYLSTARAGAMMVDEKDLEKAVEALRDGEHGLDVL